MTAAAIIELADLVKDEIIAAGFPAERDYIPLVDLAEITTLRVIVTPATKSTEMFTERDVKQTIEIDVGVFEKLDPGADNSFNRGRIDELLGIAQQIEDLFKYKLLGSYVWAGTSSEPIYDPDAMDQLRLFVGLVTLSFAVYR